MPLLAALFVLSLLLAPSGMPRAQAGNGGPAYAQRDDAMQLADDIAARHRLDAGWVRKQLAQAKLVPAVQRLIAPTGPDTAKDWAAYRARFVEPTRVRAGAAFWQQNSAWLALAEERYGVPPEIVVGILGVETLYGRQMGGFRAIDALATLAFDFPSEARRDRSAFFRDELGALFALAYRHGLDVQALRASYAGALGMPQFMPSSWRRYAIDFDGDARIDLHGSAADVIGSVANYLADAGWQRGRPTHFAVTPPGDPADRAALLAPDIVPSWNAEYFAERGAVLSDAGRQYERALALVELRNGDATPSYIAGTVNFYVVTRYNQSSYYALAVIELGLAVLAHRAAR
jgi:membrane-bound lytic murein transglycosylase B